MMKDKEYNELRFSADVIKEAIKLFRETILQLEKEYSSFIVKHDDATWSYDRMDEFIPEYRKYAGYAYFRISNGDSLALSFTAYSRKTTIGVSAKDRTQIESVFEVFERNVVASKLPPLLEVDSAGHSAPVVFIGHGRSHLWTQLKDHLQDKHEIKVIAYETGARAGHTIRDVLENMIEASTFALMLLTAEDEQADGTFRARQNVIHEAGLFQGRLGFSRAIILLEDGVETFSNLDGVQYIRFSKGNILETFGEVVATIRREFR